MKVLLLNQAFYPDVVATGQYLSQLASALVERGHEVTVITSRRAYDDPAKIFPKMEKWRGVQIIRIGSTGFGKNSKWRRAADFASFMLSCALRAAILPRQDVVVALTSPPLISFLAAWLAKFRGSRFVYWVMDFNPDEAIAAGWLKADSFAAGTLERMSRFSLRQAKKIVALDRFMRERIVAKGIAPEKIVVLPPWSHDGDVQFDAAGGGEFRKTHGLEGKFLVMHSGNHSPCHPLDTLLKAAEEFRNDDSIVFCFVGGGSELKKVRLWVEQKRAINIVCLPYQPFSQLAGSLSAADLHVVVMGNEFVGLIHPCKIYNVLKVGVPVLYVGPRPSHVTEIAQKTGGVFQFYSAEHGQVNQLVEQIQKARREKGILPRNVSSPIGSEFSKDTVLSRLIAEIESA